MGSKKISAGNYFESTLMTTECSFGDYLNFADRFIKNFEPLPYSKKSVLKQINALIKQYKRVAGVINNEKAEKILLAKDLEKVCHTLQNVRIPRPEQDLKKSYVKLKELCKKQGLTNKFPKCFIVDSFPRPYHKMNWICAFFEKDEEDDHIIPGIYLRKDRIMYAYSITKNLCHEIIHIIINQYTKKDNTIARGLEDGICDFYGSVYLFGLLHGFEKARIINYYSKFCYHVKADLVDYYRESLCLACLLYKHIGLTGMKELIKKGRNQIREAEKLCLQGKYDKIKVKRGGWNKELDKIADYYLSIQHSFCVSPIAYYIIALIKPKMKIKDLIKNNNLDKKSTMKVLKELQNKFFLITVNKGKICYDTTKNYLEVGAMRYANKV